MIRLFRRVFRQNMLRVFFFIVNRFREREKNQFKLHFHCLFTFKQQSIEKIQFGVLFFFCVYNNCTIMTDCYENKKKLSHKRHYLNKHLFLLNTYSTTMFYIFYNQQVIVTCLIVRHQEYVFFFSVPMNYDRSILKKRKKITANVIPVSLQINH